MTEFPLRSNGETVRLGFLGRCPRCAQGKMFSGFLKVADKCDVCGLSFAEHDAGDAAVVPAILVLGAFLVGFALFIEKALEPPLWALALVIAPVAIGLTMVSLPRLNGVAIALQHKHRSTEVATPPGGG